MFIKKDISERVQNRATEGINTWQSTAVRFFPILTLLILASLSFTLAQPGTSVQKTTASPPVKEFYVLQAGWHTGFILRTADVSPDDWPEVNRYLHHKWVDIGWGDERFYQHPGNPPLLAAKAILIPTPGVLQVTGFEVYPLMLYKAESRMRSIEATSRQYHLLCLAISNSFLRDQVGNPVPSAITKETGRFFRARGKYHLFNTCNTWVVKCLKEAGFEVNPTGVITREQLADELDKLPGRGWEIRQ